MVAKICGAVALFLGLVSFGWSQSPKSLKELKPFELQVGQVGLLSETANGYFVVRRIVNDTELLVTPVGIQRRLDPQTGSEIGTPVVTRGKPFWVKGVSTKGLADGKRVEFKDPFEVTGTRQEFGQTFFVVEANTQAAKDALQKVVADNQAAREAKMQRRKEQDDAARAKIAKDKERMEAEARAVNPEDAAAAKLKLIKQLIADGKIDIARYRLGRFIKDHADTKAAKEAQKLLDSLP